VRIYPGTYSIDDPTAIKQIYGSNAPLIKSKWYTSSSNPIPENWPQNIFAERDPKKHAESRKKVNMLYSMSTLVKMEESVGESLQTFRERLMEAANDARVIDLMHWMQYYAFDTLGLITVSPISRKVGSVLTDRSFRNDSGILTSAGMSWDLYLLHAGFTHCRTT
jgi:hypothetical protein